MATPLGFEPLNWVIDVAKDECKKNKSTVLITTDPLEAIKEVDVVYTDTFISIGKEEEEEKRDYIFLPNYQINDRLVEHAKSDYIFMHCLPAKRGKR